MHKCYNYTKIKKGEPNLEKLKNCLDKWGHYKVRPDDVRLALEAENIESRPIWKPMHIQPFFAKYDFVGEGISEKIFESGLCLPSDTKMTEEDLHRVVATIKGVWNKCTY